MLFRVPEPRRAVPNRPLVPSKATSPLPLPVSTTAAVPSPRFVRAPDADPAFVPPRLIGACPLGDVALAQVAIRASMSALSTVPDAARNTPSPCRTVALVHVPEPSRGAANRPPVDNNASWFTEVPTGRSALNRFVYVAS